MDFTRHTLLNEAASMAGTTPRVIPEPRDYQKAWKAPVAASGEAVDLGLLERHRWYWSLAPRERWKVDCAEAKARGLPLPDKPKD